MKRFLPCERPAGGARRYGCRYWLSLNRWAFAGEAWEDYWWSTYGAKPGACVVQALAPG